MGAPLAPLLAAALAWGYRDGDEDEGWFVVDEGTDCGVPDHRFAAAPRQTPDVKVVRREWKVLKKGLPADGSIRVRAYEARADLLRAVIVGPKGTLPKSNGALMGPHGA